MKLVIVEWLDAVSEAHAGWKALDKIRENAPIPMKSVGWIVSNTKSHVTLVSSLDKGQSEGDGDVTIPKGMVQKIIELVPKK